MTTHEEMLQTIHQPDYDFIRNNPKLGDNIMLLGLGGSRSYGVEKQSSDWDFRGFASRSPREILLGQDYETFTDNNTDTTIYSFDKILRLLADCNPNTIELLGLKPEHYLVMNDAAEYMVKNSDMFLSKRAEWSFGGYAIQQMRRLQLLAVREVNQAQREAFIMETLQHASHNFQEKYGIPTDSNIQLFIDKSSRNELDEEIFMNINIKNYPLRDYVSMINEMNAIIRSYNSIGSRNSKAIEHDKINKHQMHLARLYLMAFDILNDGKIITFREKERDFLMDIRNGKYITEDNQPTKEFKQMVDEWEIQLKHAAQHSPLPDKPDWERINKFKAEVNYSVINNSDIFREEISAEYRQ